MGSEYKQDSKNSKYNEKVTKYQKIFLEWKNWIDINNRLPNQYSQDEEERKICVNMQNISNRISKISKNKQLTSIIKEYTKIRKKYASIRKIEKAKQVFDEWKTWVEKNKNIPSRISENNIERKIAYNMYTCITCLTRIKLHNCDIISEYKSICNKYRN